MKTHTETTITMNTDLRIIMFQIRLLRPVWCSSDEEKLSEMSQIAEKVEELKFKKKFTETVEKSFGVHFTECIFVKQIWRLPSECHCSEIKLSEERFIRLFKSLLWKPSERDTYNRLLDMLLGEDDNTLPEMEYPVVDLTAPLTEETELS